MGQLLRYAEGRQGRSVQALANPCYCGVYLPRHVQDLGERAHVVPEFLMTNSGIQPSHCRAARCASTLSASGRPFPPLKLVGCPSMALRCLSRTSGRRIAALVALKTFSRQDRKKTEVLEALGWTVIRINH
jgi:hypothetical protein